MNIAIVSSRTSLNTRDIIAAATERNVECTVYPVAELSFLVDESAKHPFFQHDIYIFRGYNTSYGLAQLLAQTLVRRGKFVLDSRLADRFVSSKLHEAFVYADNDIPHIRTQYIRSQSHVDQLLVDVEYPLVIKDVASERGKGVRLCSGEKMLRTEIAAHGDRIIIQEYVPMAYDIRVLCVGERILGAIKREAASDDFRTNVSLGGVATVYELNNAERALALRAHHALGYDISGVDLAYDPQGKLLVIETNIAPEWQGFTSATGIDVGAAIIDYAIERFEHERKA